LHPVAVASSDVLLLLARSCRKATVWPPERTQKEVDVEGNGGDWPRASASPFWKTRSASEGGTRIAVSQGEVDVEGHGEDWP
jgi:hypothetical protein